MVGDWEGGYMKPWPKCDLLAKSQFSPICLKIEEAFESIFNWPRVVQSCQDEARKARRMLSEDTCHSLFRLKNTQSSLISKQFCRQLLGGRCHMPKYKLLLMDDWSPSLHGLIILDRAYPQPSSIETLLQGHLGTRFNEFKTLLFYWLISLRRHFSSFRHSR